MKSLSFAATLALMFGAAGCVASDANSNGTPAAVTPASVSSPPSTTQPPAESAANTTGTPSGSDAAVDSLLPTPDCEARFKDAAAVDDLQDTVSDFYPALQQCEGLDDWVAASAAVPDALDGVDPIVFAYNACTSGGPTESTTCVEALAADPFGAQE